ncbi:polysaccharide deacetylase family protein [Hydrogenimonas thermophila]|uniref:Polysaccharide deacetylase n=1 Tax=Hydrogenimonas thermophila TaxID=223786 RepID=A0A1I5U629_9BACT|nr:polysaccharide deacetylase family protein [Hydrogenimonas thermophila]SFP90016.1 Polysaccharide deacetylase [Hydrogenimonas thermophila]
MAGITILMYHQIGKFPPMKDHRATYCDINRFKQQMWYLHKFKYNVISLDELVNIFQNKKSIPSKTVVLTFDDGYENFLTQAVPVLSKYNFPAIVYVVPSLIGKKAEWLALDGHPTPQMLTLEQLREVRNLGFQVGSHNLVHERMAQKTLKEQIYEVIESKKILEELLQEEIKHFCYPYGSYNIDSLKAVEAGNYTTAVTCQRAAATPDFDLLALPRKAISFGDTLLGFIFKLHAKNLPKSVPLHR